MSFLVNPFSFAVSGIAILFEWNPETGEALPGSATFTRASAAFYRNDSGVWVEASSGALRLHNLTPGGGEKGYLPETAATNLALHSRDFTDVVWSASDITPVKDATGIDGVANAASTLTSTAANGTIFQSFTRSSSAHTFSVFVARKTGTGTIEMTIDGGTTYVDITSSLTSDITDDAFVVTQTLANPSIGFRIVTSGDEIEVDIAQLEATAFGTAPIETTSGTATRLADLVDTGVDLTTEISAFADVTGPTVALTVQNYAIIAVDDSFSNSLLENRGTATIRANVGGCSPSVTNDIRGVRKKMAMSAKDDTNGVIFVDEDSNSATATPSSATWDGSEATIGKTNTSSFIFRGVIHDVTIYGASQTQAELEALVA